MESIFPDLLFLGPYFAPLVLRVAAGIALFIHAKRMWGPTLREQAFSIKESLFGLLLVVGFLTQLVAIVAIVVIIGKSVWLKSGKENLGENILLIGILLALVISGAGAFAVDVPY